MSQKWKQICSALTEAESQTRAGSQAWLPAQRATPLQNIPSGRRQGPGQATALITSELAPASKAHAWTFQIFPLLSLTFPYSLISPRHPPTHTLFLLTLPFHFCSKTNNPGQMCQLASGKGSLQHELCGGYTACGGGAGGVMGRITHRRAELSGSSAGGLPRLGHWAMTGTSLAPLPNQDLAWDHISKVSLAKLYTPGHMIKNTASNPPFFGGSDGGFLSILGTQHSGG